MSDPAARAAIADGFRRLRPAVHAWLAREPALRRHNAPTGAYADLTFAFGFARLGAAADTRQCLTAAESALASRAGEAHAWLLRLYRYRIEEALAGRRHGGIVPDAARLPSAGEIRQLPGGERNGPLEREGYPVKRLAELSRVLDPERCADAYESWETDARQRQVNELRHFTDPDRVEAVARALLASADDVEPHERVREWRRVFPMVRRGCPGYATELLFAAPDVLAAPPPRDWPDWRRTPLDLFGCAVEHAAGLPGAEPFPPLVGAGVGLAARDVGTPALADGLARVTWPSLRWFRALDPGEEAAAFLYHTKDLWPAWPEGTSTRSRVLLALLPWAALRAYAGRPDELPRALDAVAAAGPGTEWYPKDEVELAIGFARSAALTPPAEAFDRLVGLLTTLPPLSDTFTTAAWFSRFHFEIIEAMVLAFPAVGDW